MTGKNHNNCNYCAAFETNLRVAAMLSVLHVLIYFVSCTDFFFDFFSFFRRRRSHSGGRDRYSDTDLFTISK